MISFVRDMLRVLNMPCKEHAFLFGKQLDAPLARGTSVGLWLHLRVCKGCSAWTKHLHAIRSLFKALEEREQNTPAMPAHVRERIATRMREAHTIL